MAETFRSDADAARIIFAAILMAIYGFGLREPINLQPNKR
jgi:hypothetical protein